MSNHREGAMGFDLWRMLGVSPESGLAMVGAGLVCAALLAVRMFRRRTATDTRPALGLGDDRRVN